MKKEPWIQSQHQTEFYQIGDAHCAQVHWQFTIGLMSEGDLFWRHLQSDLCISLIANEMHTRIILLVHMLKTNKPVPLVSETIPQTPMNRFWGVYNLGTMRKTQSLAEWQATNTTLRWHLTIVGRRVWRSHSEYLPTKSATWFLLKWDCWEC